MSIMVDMESTEDMKSIRNKKVQERILGIIGVFLVIIIILLAKEQDTLSIETVHKIDTSKDDIIYEGETYEYNPYLNNYLFLGIDTEGDIDIQKEVQSAGQADVIYLVSYNRKEKTLRVLSIPRDTMTEIEIFGRNGKSLGKSIEHINIQYAFGNGGHDSCRKMVEAVSNLFYQVPISGYCAINMESMTNLLEQTGPLHFVLPNDSMETLDPMYSEGTMIKVTVDNVNEIIRYRNVEEKGSVFERSERQEAFVRAYLEEMQSLVGTNPQMVTTMYMELSEHMITNIGKDVFFDLYESSLSNKDTENIYKVPGEVVSGEIYDEYHVDEEQLKDLSIRLFYIKKGEN